MRFYELRKKYDTPAYFPAYRSTPPMDSYFQEKIPTCSYCLLSVGAFLLVHIMWKIVKCNIS